ncbi:hypothetical protein LOZ61_002253 [Ophidiomyces ophidiicola]|uniref:Uncharacterized protein n=1 Tax=Ophidiomyces ophidiicola TaxID=1387563 RepID=A0ACB8UWW1_9EURO|nr:hypothetical protein LOZ61_002253 [Ophidiomyces ophidiicola]KAI1926992.1 hypothetical protein LOZ64_000125 [Ophidiomyces ophidiicola]KAI1929163.1 hypothetical protein LOZ60_001814 [Ophidiomyces ophidiicola]KAI1963586.1 hypothetical protein LOZ59_001786 [Ophidiomyces ophidiicola]KAI1974092.1 hypothetical protein LOZ56_001495 [Ophidiomyces ophidiicola]
MTAALPYLRSLRKTDLVVLAAESHLQNYGDFKKVELEAALDEHLSANKSALSDNQVFNDYFKRLSQPPRSSPIKKEPKPDAPSGIDPLASPTKRSTRSVTRTLKPKDEIDATEESESSSRASGSPSNEPAAARTPARQTQGFFSAIPPSPAVVTEVIEEQTTKVGQFVSNAWVASGVKERAFALRSCLSSVSMIETLIIAFEFYCLSSQIIPSQYLGTIPETSALHIPAIPVKIPEIFVLLTAEFWGPFSLWIATSIVLPTILAYFFNINLKVTQPNTPSHSYGTRRASAAQAVNAAAKPSIDPLVFNVSKALISYLVYTNTFTFGGIYSHVSVERVVRSVPGGLPGLLTGSAVCVLGSLYEAILRK